MESLDDPARIDALRNIIQKKEVLRNFYVVTYRKYAAALGRCPSGGMALELGSGGGFVKQILPEIITSDVIPYAGVDQIVNAYEMPFPDESLKLICMQNVLHHINDVERFFREASRCLVPGGRIYIMEPYPGWIGGLVYRYVHHESFVPGALEWKFESSGPLSDANTALAWIVFERDRKHFEELFPELRIVGYAPHSPLIYWLSGGLNKWSLLPSWGYRLAASLDSLLIAISERFGSYVDIELEKTST